MRKLYNGTVITQTYTYMNARARTCVFAERRRRRSPRPRVCFQFDANLARPIAILYGAIHNAGATTRLPRAFTDLLFTVPTPFTGQLIIYLRRRDASIFERASAKSKRLPARTDGIGVRIRGADDGETCAECITREMVKECNKSPTDTARSNLRLTRARAQIHAAH